MKEETLRLSTTRKNGELDGITFSQAINGGVGMYDFPVSFISIIFSPLLLVSPHEKTNST